MRIVFMGTPDFAVPTLRRLIAEHEVVCVYTREPKPSGRGNHLNKTPIHILAEENGIEVRTPKTLRSAQEQEDFAALKADAAVVAAYGLLLPKPILEAYPLGCLNVHASLLPRWRGAAPIQRAIEAGDQKSGVTIMQIAEGLDTGDMLLKESVEITKSMNGGELHDILAQMGADILIKVLADIKSFAPQKQNDNEACYAKKLDKAETQIDFSRPVSELYNKIRAFSPFPAMYFEYGGERFKLLKVALSDKNLPSGQIACDAQNLWLGCSDGSLQVLEIQRQGKRPMAISELLRGFTFTGGKQC